MDRIDALRLFLAVADKNSFAEAARSLRVSPAAATRAIALLEDELGLVLLSRTTRVVRLTERGGEFAERCRRILAEWEDAQSAVRGQDAEPRGLMSITAPVLFGRLHVLPLVESLLAEHPLLRVRLTLLDRVVQLVEEGFDLAVRIGVLPDNAMIAARLTEVRRVVVASPSYLEIHGEPAEPADLKAHRIIAFEGIGAPQEWRFGASGRTGVAVAPRLFLNSADAAIAAAIRDGGITRALSYQVDDDVQNGRLRRILRAYEPEPIPVSVVYPPSRRGSPNVNAFVHAARTRLARLSPD